MFIVKVTEETIDQVVAKSKYASDGIPRKAQVGDVILISLSNVNKDEKRIRFVMRYNGYIEDGDGESKKLWGKQWRYIINGIDIQPVRPFNMEDIQIREKPYVFNMGNYLYVDSTDEEAVLKHLYIGKNSTEAYAIYPDDLPDNSTEYREGKKKTVQVNIYERNPAARQKCIKYYGVNCYVCGFDFGKTYGEKCDGMIHVHHLKMVSDADKKYIVNPVNDLRPVCPNCYMVLHSKKDGCYTIEEVKEMLGLSK